MTRTQVLDLIRSAPAAGLTARDIAARTGLGVGWVQSLARRLGVALPTLADHVSDARKTATCSAPLRMRPVRGPLPPLNDDAIAESIQRQRDADFERFEEQRRSTPEQQQRDAAWEELKRTGKLRLGRYFP